MYHIGAPDVLPTLPTLDVMSVNGLDFIKKCLVKIPDDRDTALTLLKHPFLAIQEIDQRELEDWIVLPIQKEY